MITHGDLKVELLHFACPYRPARLRFDGIELGFTHVSFIIDELERGVAALSRWAVRGCPTPAPCWAMT